MYSSTLDGARQYMKGAKEFAAAIRGDGNGYVGKGVASLHRQLVSGPSSTAPGPEETRFIERLLAAFKSVPPESTPTELRLHGMWSEVVSSKPRFGKTLQERNPLNLWTVLQAFHWNEAIEGLGWSADAYRRLTKRPISASAFVAGILSKYEAIYHFCGADLAALAFEGSIGQPIHVELGDMKVSPNGVRHASYCNNLRPYLSALPLRPVVAELGAGYGNLARTILSSVANQPIYIILDIPWTLPLAAYFLRGHFPSTRIAFSTDFPTGSTIDRQALSSYDLVFLNNWDLVRLEESLVDVLINTGSLAELSAPAVKKYLFEFARVSRSGGLFYSVNRARGRGYDGRLYKGVIETGTEAWSDWLRGWRTEANRPSWGDQQFVFSENVDYREIVFRREDH